MAGTKHNQTRSGRNEIDEQSDTAAAAHAEFLGQVVLNETSLALLQGFFRFFNCAKLDLAPSDSAFDAAIGVDDHARARGARCGAVDCDQSHEGGGGAFSLKLGQARVTELAHRNTMESQPSFGKSVEIFVVFGAVELRDLVHEVGVACLKDEAGF